MVSQKTKCEKRYYVCDECGFAYEKKEWAQKCETWCAKYKSCNLEITRHAVQI